MKISANSTSFVKHLQYKKNNEKKSTKNQMKNKIKITFAKKTLCAVSLNPKYINISI